LISWQAILDIQPNKMVADFQADVLALIEECMKPVSHEDQMAHVSAVAKPFTAECGALGACLKVINRICCWLPGSLDDNGAGLHNDDKGLKRCFFQMMPVAWKVEFAKRGHTLRGAGHTYPNLVCHMLVQEAISKRGTKRKAEGAPGSSSGCRHNQNGGRGHHGGCGHFGGHGCGRGGGA
jgi:hypothetical protein